MHELPSRTESDGAHALPDAGADDSFHSILQAMTAQGHVFLAAERTRVLLGQPGATADWDGFADSWNTLPVDEFMADHGRYRRRRHAVYGFKSGAKPVLQPRQAHFQSLDYNALNGGIARWYEPIEPAFATGPSMTAILAFCHALFSTLVGAPTDWRVEVHQFRIEAVSGAPGLPTPEGMHRDGVDYVLVLLVSRCNIDSGTTLIGSSAEGFTSSFTLSSPFDAALVDDHRVFHGVTPVTPIESALPAYRDVLVVTFRQA